MLHCFGPKAAMAAFLLSSSAPMAETAPKFSTDIPSKITTPDSTETRIGTLRFTNGAPDAETVTAVCITSTSCAPFVDGS